MFEKQHSITNFVSNKQGRQVKSMIWMQNIPVAHIAEYSVDVA